MDQTLQLIQLATGYWVSQMLHVAAELGVADQLVERERPVQELAEAVGADPDSLFRLLRGLASIGVFEERAPRCFALTPLAELLCSDHPGSQRQFVRMLGGEHYEAWGELLHSVRSGENAFPHRFGEPIFSWYANHPQRGEIFAAAMGDFSRVETGAFLEAYDFGGIEHLVDGGGGRGELLKAVLRRHGQLRGTLYDQPAVVAPVTLTAELEGRLSVAGGDFFEAVPSGGDAYLLKHILHDWGDGACITILGLIRAALAVGGRVLILEQVIPAGNDPSPGKLLDLNMLVMTEGGRERTPSEYAQLLQRAGLRLVAIHPTAAPISIVEAVAA